MWSKSLISSHLKNDLGGSPNLWWKRSAHTFGRCWIQVQFAPAMVYGVMRWCWFERRMEAYAFVLHCVNTHMKKDSYPLQRIQEVLESMVGDSHFSCLDLKSGFWQIKMDESSKQYTAFTVGNLGFFKCDHMPFGLCNAPATFQWLMQNCLGEMNLTDCLIYLDDWVVFSQIAEEHLHCLCIIFDWFSEHNLKLKPLKCSFFREEITYLVHWVSKDGPWPSNSNLEAIAECMPPHTYTEVCAFLGLMGHYRRFIKGFACIPQPLSKHLGKEPAGSQSGCHLQKIPWWLSKHWKWHVWHPPFWLSLTTLNCSCWRLMPPRMDWGQCCHRSRQMGSTTLSPMTAGPLCLMRRTTTQQSSSF